eukprot:CAMPEP_0171131714 /NCGR_PEP_ID=MMETSP0766_2-20121228/123267_1 /TAXON_ID=439317 /ORGANISM="Gambierdiscus australes, Strain CAWD 149" /LENGTH=132 /DNA_ID=CAMNT_0011595027 /DNA_START=68 /DNA_END=468 /DNA_ORIENTATION=+
MTMFLWPRRWHLRKFQQAEEWLEGQLCFCASSAQLMEVEVDVTEKLLGALNPATAGGTGDSTRIFDGQIQSSDKSAKECAQVHHAMLVLKAPSSVLGEDHQGDAFEREERVVGVDERIIGVDPVHLHRKELL